MNAEWVGMIAAVFTTAAYIPQTLKVIKSRDTRSISLGMYVLITLGIAIWMIYGVMINSISLIIANSITLVMAGTILVMKIRHG